MNFQNTIHGMPVQKVGRGASKTTVVQSIGSAGQNTHQKVFEILNTKYFLKSIANTKIPNTFS